MKNLFIILIFILASSLCFSQGPKIETGSISDEDFIFGADVWATPRKLNVEINLGYNTKAPILTLVAINKANDNVSTGSTTTFDQVGKKYFFVDNLAKAGGIYKLYLNIKETSGTQTRNINLPIQYSAPNTTFSNEYKVYDVLSIFDSSVLETDNKSLKNIIGDVINDQITKKANSSAGFKTILDANPNLRNHITDIVLNSMRVSAIKVDNRNVLSKSIIINKRLQDESLKTQQVSE